VERHEEKQKQTDEQKLSHERLLRGQVRRKKGLPKFLGRSASGTVSVITSRQENDEIAMATRMKREVRRRSMAYADGVGDDDLDINGFPTSFKIPLLQHANVDGVGELCSEVPGEGDDVGGADRPDAAMTDGSGKAWAGGKHSVDGYEYASNGNKIFLSLGGCPSVSMEAVTNRTKSARSQQQFMNTRVAVARHELARRLNIGLPEERAAIEAESARLGDRAQRIGHRHDLRLREQMSGMTDDRNGNSAAGKRHNSEATTGGYGLDQVGDGDEYDDSDGYDSGGHGNADREVDRKKESLHFQRGWGTNLLEEDSELPTEPSLLSQSDGGGSVDNRGYSGGGDGGEVDRPQTSHSTTRVGPRLGGASYNPDSFGFGAIGRLAYAHDDDTSHGDAGLEALIPALGIDADVAARLALAPNPLQLTASEMLRVPVAERYRWDQQRRDGTAGSGASLGWGTPSLAPPPPLTGGRALSWQPLSNDKPPKVVSHAFDGEVIHEHRRRNGGSGRGGGIGGSVLDSRRQPSTTQQISGNRRRGVNDYGDSDGANFVGDRKQRAVSAGAGRVPALTRHLAHRRPSASWTVSSGSVGWGGGNGGVSLDGGHQLRTIQPISGSGGGFVDGGGWGWGEARLFAASSPRRVGAVARASALSAQTRVSSHDAVLGDPQFSTRAGMTTFGNDPRAAPNASDGADRGAVPASMLSRRKDRAHAREHPTGVAMRVRLLASRGVREHQVRMLGRTASTAAAQMHPTAGTDEELGVYDDLYASAQGASRGGGGDCGLRLRGGSHVGVSGGIHGGVNAGLTVSRGVHGGGHPGLIVSRGSRVSLYSHASNPSCHGPADVPNSSEVHALMHGGVHGGRAVGAGVHAQHRQTVSRGPLDMLNPTGTAGRLGEGALLVELGLPDPHFCTPTK